MNCRAKKQFQGTTHSAPRNTENRTNFSKNGQRKGAPQGKDSEKKSPGRKTERSGYKGKNPRDKGKGKESGKKDFSKLEKKRKGWAEAFKDVPQDKIDKYKEEGKDCRRCGRANHMAIHCYAGTTIDGDKLPIPPSTASAASTQSNKRPRPPGFQPKNPTKVNKTTSAANPTNPKPTTASTLYEPWSEEDSDQEMEDQEDFY